MIYHRFHQGLQLLKRRAALAGNIPGFVGIDIMVVQFAGNHLTRLKFFPFRVPVPVGADGVAHDFGISPGFWIGWARMLSQGSFPFAK